LALISGVKKLVRSIVEKRTRGIILKRRLPPTFGYSPIFVTPEAGLKYLFRPISEADPQLLALANEFVYPGSVVWDVGANIGLFSVAAAHKAGSKGKVIAIEPDIWLDTLLQRSAHAQPENTAPINIISAAVADKLGIRNFLIAARARATNSLEGFGSTQTGGTRQRQPVITVTLDWLGEYYSLPNILKIDVEGAELEVLLGGLNILKKAMPIIIVEVTHQESIEQIGKLLHELRYELFDADAFSHERKPLLKPAYNTLAIPKES